MKYKWAAHIRTTKKHRDIRFDIITRREQNREPTPAELEAAVGDKNKYDDLRDSEIVQAYEEGHVVRAYCRGFTGCCG